MLYVKTKEGQSLIWLDKSPSQQILKKRISRPAAGITKANRFQLVVDYEGMAVVDHWDIRQLWINKRLTELNCDIVSYFS